MFLKIKFYFIAVLFLIPFFFLSSSVLADWSTDLTPPNCTIPQGTTMAIGTAASITVSSNEPAATLASIVLSVNPAVFVPKTSSTSPITFTWATTGLSAGNYTFTNTVTDTTGNVNMCNFIYTLNTLNSPWLKTSGGDVHSNRQ